MFLPETTKETREQINEIIGSWKIEGLEISAQTIRDMELVDLGVMTYDDAVQGIIHRNMNHG